MAVLEQSVIGLSARQTHTFPGGNEYTFRKVGDGGDISVFQADGKVELLNDDGDEVKIPATSLGNVYVAVGETGGSIFYERQEPEHPNDGMADEDNPGLGEPDPADAPILQHPDKGVLIKDEKKVLPADRAREERFADRGLSLEDRVKAEEEADGQALPGTSVDGTGHERALHGPLVQVPKKSRKSGAAKAGKKPPKPDKVKKVKDEVKASTSSTGGRQESIEAPEKGDKGKTRSQKVTRDNVKAEDRHSPVPVRAERDVRKKRGKK